MSRNRLGKICEVWLAVCALAAAACGSSGQDRSDDNAVTSGGLGGSFLSGTAHRSGAGTSTTSSTSGVDSRGSAGGSNIYSNVGGSVDTSVTATAAIGVTPNASASGGLGQVATTTFNSAGDVNAGGASDVTGAHSGGASDFIATHSGGVTASHGGTAGTSMSDARLGRGGTSGGGVGGTAIGSLAATSGGPNGEGIGGKAEAAGAAGVAGALTDTAASGRAGSAGSVAMGAFTAAGTMFAGAGSTNELLTTPQIPPSPIPTIETASFTPSGSTTDIADDSAIYANPNSPELSVIVADNKDDKQGGVGVFDMQGNLLEFRQDGMIGNIDLRTNFPFNGESVVLVGANNRTNDTLIFWQLDPATRRLSAPIGASTATIAPSYGFCLYHSAMSGKFYAFVTQLTGKSTMQQFELDTSNGKVAATLVRSFDVGSITEGCVADDELGWLYVAHEDVALWRYGAEPTSGGARTQVGAVGDGQLVADLEGLAIAKGPGNSGYLVVSVQGADRFVTYDRVTNAYLGGFSIGANGAIDAVTQTDGLDINTSNLGPGFEHGALVVHDGDNIDGGTSNLKYVPLL